MWSPRDYYLQDIKENSDYLQDIKENSDYLQDIKENSDYLQDIKENSDYLQDIKENSDYLYVYLDGSYQLETTLQSYRQSSGIFLGILHKRSRESNQKHLHFNTRTPLVEMKGNMHIEFSGLPFTLEATIVYDCTFGKGNHQNRKILDYDG